ncbi:MAG: hypothetical protein Q4G64_08210, partial [bacterium]|nr:hypothetical protein [bacterium]
GAPDFREGASDFGLTVTEGEGWVQMEHGPAVVVAAPFEESASVEMPEGFGLEMAFGEVAVANGHVHLPAHSVAVLVQQ